MWLVGLVMLAILVVLVVLTAWAGVVALTAFGLLLWPPARRSRRLCISLLGLGVVSLAAAIVSGMILWEFWDSLPMNIPAPVVTPS